MHTHTLIRLYSFEVVRFSGIIFNPLFRLLTHSKIQGISHEAQNNTMKNKLQMPQIMQKRLSALKELCWNNINDTMRHMLHE